MKRAATKSVSGGQSVRLSSYLVVEFRLASGEAVPLVVKRATRLPEVYVLRYALITYRSPGLSPNSMRNALQGIALGLSFLDDHKIDLMQRVASGLFLTREELAAFADRCLRRADARGAVVRAYAKNRYQAFLAYLGWRFEAVLHRASKDSLGILKLDLAEFRKRSRAQKPKGRSGAQEQERLGLKAAQRQLLLEVTHPDSPRNPFSPKLRKRNRALILLHYQLGLRAGELAGLQRVDYSHREKPERLIVHVRDNFAGDTRTNAPRVKTRARILILAPSSAEALNTWLAQRANRGEFPMAHRSHYIFVSGSGRELSLRAAREVFERLRAVYPQLEGISSHILRHDMNDRLIEHAEQDGMSAETATQDMIYINGWSDGTTMHLNYTKRSRAQRSNKRIYDNQKRSMDR